MDMEKLIKAYEEVVRPKSTAYTSIREERELKGGKIVRESRRYKRSPRQIITEAFAQDPNLILEDEVNGFSFKVKSIEPAGVRVVERKSGKTYLFPWSVFEL